MRNLMTAAQGAAYGRRFAQRLLAMDDATPGTETDVASPKRPYDASDPSDEPEGDPVETITDWAQENMHPDEIRDLIGHLRDYALNEGNVAPNDPMNAVMRGANAPPRRLGSAPEPSRHLIGDPGAEITKWSFLNMHPQQIEDLIAALEPYATQKDGPPMAGDKALLSSKFADRFPHAARIGHQAMARVANRAPAPPLPLNPSVSFTKDARQLRRAVARIGVQPLHGGGSNQPPTPRPSSPHSRSGAGMALDRAASGFAQRFPDAARIKNADGRTS
jgi:hypothetical protein